MTSSAALRSSGRVIVWVWLLVALALAGAPSGTHAQAGDAARLADGVEVIRTLHGVPHIYAETFEALGYALGYLQVEDYGDRVPIGLLRARGELALREGPSALDSDFESLPYYLRAVEVYPRLGDDTRAVYEGFAAGVNHYMARHPGEFADWATAPFTGYDVAALHVYRPNGGQIRRWVARLTGASDAPLAEPASGDDPIEEGSSAWALAPSRTASGAAILLRNPHLGWNAGYWEVHAVVPGRLDFYGDFRIGAPLGIIGGFNAQLGFATTNNDVDNAQVYALEADPASLDHYLLDGASIPLERELLTRRFRSGDAYGYETRERVFTTLGRVIHRDHGRIYVLRAPEDGGFRSGEQFLRMIQAQSLDEWMAAMEMRAHPRSNFTYADAAGNVLYLWNAAMPVFPHPYDDERAVPATGQSDMWQALHPISELPQVLNPPGGYVRNENDGPWLTNLAAPLDPADFPAYFEAHEFSLRSQHSALLVGGGERLSLEDVIARKHSYRMLLAERVKDDMITAARPAAAAGAELTRALDLIEAWDDTVAPESRGGVLFQAWWDAYADAREAADGDDAELFAAPWSADAPMTTPRGVADPMLAAQLLPDVLAAVRARHGGWDLAWGEVHRVRRGDVDVPVGGCAGRLGCYRVINYRDDPDGLRRADGGDGWVLAVEFTSPPRAFSVLAYGQSSREDSSHHDDQAAMFARGELKSVAFTREDVERAAVRRYRPGME